jgi:hypothetical protein
MVITGSQVIHQLITKKIKLHQKREATKALRQIWYRNLNFWNDPVDV